MSAPLLGLVLAGGRSSRMGSDKAALRYGEQTQLERAMELAEPVRAARPSSRFAPTRQPIRCGAKFAQIVDGGDVEGPAAGIRAAQRRDPRRRGWCWPATCRSSSAAPSST